MCLAAAESVPGPSTGALRSVLLSVADRMHGREVEGADVTEAVTVEQVDEGGGGQQLVVDQRLEELDAGHDPARHAAQALGRIGQGEVGDDEDAVRREG